MEDSTGCSTVVAEIKSQLLSDPTVGRDLLIDVTNSLDNDSPDELVSFIGERWAMLSWAGLASDDLVAALPRVVSDSFSACDSLPEFEKAHSHNWNAAAMSRPVADSSPPAMTTGLSPELAALAAELIADPTTGIARLRTISTDTGAAADHARWAADRLARILWVGLTYELDGAEMTDVAFEAWWQWRSR